MARSTFTPQTSGPGHLLRRLYDLSQKTEVQNAGMELAKSVKKFVDAVRGA